ncbi:MAG: hypothetical protein A3D92_24790 [Bacteroidetes bacterium RIFCSPHIGHO2_02_FULL_44_7]|nr:MAG: hypothetical protein A3D92_24790 [Bacteroidetes bacterium RIFCSPHIGHO2_02_FULL_44_7]
MSFLSAEWRKLVMANYVVDPKVLLPYLPAGTTLDVWNGKCYLSLVGFLFKETRLKGIKVPFHVNFEEVNLRFYVVRKTESEERRGVVFIQEIVAKPALSLVANVVFRENYVTRRMQHSLQVSPNGIQVQYAWKTKNKWNKMEVLAAPYSAEITPGSEVEFITEHYWGYAKKNTHKTNEYEVTHPRWVHYPVQESTIDVDFGMTYGDHFAFLNTEQPVSIFLAEGSEITVEPKKTLPS